MFYCPRGVGSVVPNAVAANAATLRSRSNDPFPRSLQTRFPLMSAHDLECSPASSHDRRMGNYPGAEKNEDLEGEKRSVGNGRFHDPKLKGDAGLETPRSTGARESGGLATSHRAHGNEIPRPPRWNGDTTPREARTTASQSVAKTRASSIATALSPVGASLECVERARLVSGHGIDGRDAPAPRGRPRR